MSSPAPSLPLVITPGEPAGIGPDLLLALASAGIAASAVALADPRLLRARAQTLGLDVSIETVEHPAPAAPAPPGRLRVQPVPLARQVPPGAPDPSNAVALLRALDLAVEGCRAGRFSALVTGPLSKATINAAGIAFTGHTEYLAQRCGAPQPVMMLAGGGLRVALVTTHLPLRAVADAIDRERLTAVIRTLHGELRRRFALASPRIAVLGLNPHAGENGHLGTEDRDVIVPVLDALRAEGLELTGPLAADTAFTAERLGDADVVLAMYHDQGLPVLKHASFGHAVNITLGLPLIRTSVDHGTAFDLAGTGRADPESLRAAITSAAAMAARAVLQSEA